MSVVWVDLHCLDELRPYFGLSPFDSDDFVGFDVSNQVEIFELFELPTLAEHARPPHLQQQRSFLLTSIVNIEHVAWNLALDQSWP